MIKQCLNVNNTNSIVNLLLNGERVVGRLLVGNDTFSICE